MSNDIAKALKQKTDAMLRLQGQSQKPVVYENSDGSFTAPEKSDYTAVLAAGKNVQILVSGNVKTIHVVMGILAGNNITVSSPDPITGKVTITGTIAGKGINIADFAGKNGYVLTYDSVSDKFILAAQSGNLAQATESALGGIKAKAKTTETAEVAIDPATGKLYVPAPDEAANGLPQGGTTGQVPVKVDGTDYNVAWADFPSGGGGLIALPSYLTGTASGSAYAWKGNMFKPDFGYKIHAIGYIGNLVAGATYQAAVITKTAGNLIETIVKSPKKTLPASLSSLSTKSLWFKFDVPITLTIGISYYLMIGRTDSTDTYVLPLPFSGGTGNENAVPMMGLSHGNSGLIAKANPIIGDPISLNTVHSVAQYFLFEQL